MAILEKEVWVGLGGSNIKHFESLGYKIPREPAKYNKNKLIVPNGAKILVKTADLQKSCMEKVTKICDIDGCGKKSPNQPYDAILKARELGDGKDRCFDCGKKKARKALLNSIKYEKSLENYAKENNKEYLINEYSIKNEKRPFEISYGSGQKYFWNCPKCLNEYYTTASSRTNSSSGCPFCSGKKVLVGFNDLWTSHPDVAKVLKNPQRGYEMTAGSNKIETFVCKDCGKEKGMTSNDLIMKGFGCTRCGDGVKFPEKVTMNVLDQLGVVYETQKIFNWSGNKRYDFYIPDYNLIIETHGGQHYKFTGFKRTLKQEKQNDNLKELMAKNAGINNYIIVNCSQSNIEFIKNSIIESELSNLLDLRNINWSNCNEFASNSNLLKEVCSLWNSGVKSTLEIGKIVKLERSAVARYLKRGKELLWCDYDSKEVQRQNGLISGKSGEKITRQVVQLSLDGKYVREWSSIAEVGRELGINTSGITSVCKGRNKTAGSYKWIYKEDYDELLEVKEII